MTKQEALRTARKFVTVCRNGSSWAVIAPRNASEPRGIKVEYSTETYRRAQIRAAVETAQIALNLLDRATPEAMFEIEAAAFGSRPKTTTIDLLNAGLA